MDNIPTPVQLGIVTALECVINVTLFPWILPGRPITSLFVLLYSANALLFLLYSMHIYPYYVSPWRKLARPNGGFPILYQSTVFASKPSGERFRKWLSEVPNDGVIRFPGFFNQDWLLLANMSALAEVLVQRCYDWHKPQAAAEFLSLVLGDGLIVVEDDVHKFQRRNVAPAFSFRHVKELYPIFWAKSVEMVQLMTAELQEEAHDANKGSSTSAEGSSGTEITGELEVNHWANKATLDIIGLAGLGRDFGSLKNPHDPLVQTYEEILEPTREKAFFFLCNIFLGRRFVSKLPWRLNQRLKTTTGMLKQYCGDIIATKKQNLKDGVESNDVDILSLLIKSDNFSDDNLIDQLLTFLAAGHETTSSAFTWSTYLLATNLSIQTRLRTEIRAALPPPSQVIDPSTTDLATILESLPLLNGVANETLRLYPTVPTTARAAIRDTQIGSHFVAKGTRAYMSPWAINRSPTIWGPDAESFIPERWIDGETGKPNNTGGVTSNYSILTFLHGPRSCIGERFAKSELRALIAVMVGSFELTMANPDEKPVPAGAVTTKPRDGMHLKVRAMAGW